MLSGDLLAEVARAVAPERAERGPVEAKGTARLSGGRTMVELDGSDGACPVASATASVRDGDRVLARITGHGVSIVGNLTDPSASASGLEGVANQVVEVGELVAGKVSTGELEAQIARIDQLTANDVEVRGRLTAAEADIGELTADNATITGRLEAAEGDIDHLTSSKAEISVLESDYATIASLDAVDADVRDLQADYADFKVASADRLTAAEAAIGTLDADKLDAESADIRYAAIDFANIGKAAIESFLSKSGMVSDLVVGEGTVTGKLVGVTIVGDLIEGGTVKADKLVVQGEDGLYYKLNVSGETVAAEQTDYNSLNGSVITAQSITADKVSVSDLVAFGATIGGFAITEDALHSGVKSSALNTTPGVYLDSSGQLSAGDQSSYLRVYEDGGEWRLEISADSISMGSQTLGSLFATKAELELAEQGITQTVSAAKETAESALAQSSKAVQTAQGIAQTVEESYLPRDEAGELYASKSYVDQKADSITQEVEGQYLSKTDASAKYYTKTEVDQKDSSITLTAQAAQTAASNASSAASSASTKVSQLEVSVNGLSSRVQDAEGNVSDMKQTVDGFQVTLNNTKKTVYNYAQGTVGATGYIAIATIKITYQYANVPIYFKLMNRAQRSSNVWVQFANSSSLDPGLSLLSADGTMGIYIQKTTTSTWRLIVHKSEGWDTVSVVDFSNGGTYMNDKVTVTWTDVMLTSLPSGYVTATRLAGSRNSADIDNAAKTATNYLKFDSSGLCVGNMTGTLQGNTLLTSSGVQIRNGSTVLMSATGSRAEFFTGGVSTLALTNAPAVRIGASSGKYLYADNSVVRFQSGSAILSSYTPTSISLGANSSSSAINFCGGQAHLGWFSAEGTKLYGSGTTIIQGASSSQGTRVTVGSTSVTIAGTTAVDIDSPLLRKRGYEINSACPCVCVTKVLSASSATSDPVLFTSAQIASYASQCGATQTAYPAVSVTNGDWGAKATKLIGTSNQNGNVVLHCQSAFSGSLRVNCIIAFPT